MLVLLLLLLLVLLLLGEKVLASAAPRCWLEISRSWLVSDGW